MELELEHTQQGFSYEVSVAVCSSLQSLKPKRTIEYRAKRSSKIISLGHYSIMLASSHTVKRKMEILLEPTSNKLLVGDFGFNLLVHSFCALSTLRRFGLRTASTAAKPCQGDSSEFYLIIGKIPTVVAAGQRDVNSQLHAHTSNLLSMTRWQLNGLQHIFHNSDVCCYVQEKCGHAVQLTFNKPRKIYKEGDQQVVSEPFGRYALWEVIINDDSPVPEPPAVAIPDEHLLKFYSIKDAKSLWEAIKIRFQKLISQLELNGEVISHEDANIKLPMSLPPAWNNIALIMKNKPDIETLSMDDLYNNLKVYEAEIKGKSSSGSNSHNIAFVSSKNTSKINKTINAAHDISTAGSKEQTSASSYADDLVLLRQNLNVTIATEEGILLENVVHQGIRVIGVLIMKEELFLETLASALVVQDGLGGYDWSYQAEEGPTDFALMTHSLDSANSSNSEDQEIFDNGCSKHLTGNKSFPTGYQEIDGGFVAFEGSPKGGKITGDLTCLFAKATIDESNLWHRRFGHINFKTLNKLVRGNLNLVTKPHNKTPYELLIGRLPNLEFMRPFGCPVTILNILDHQVSARNQSNGDACIQTDIHAGQASQEKAVVHEYILLPFISSNPSLSSIIQSSDVNAGDQPGDVNASDIQGDVDEISRNDDVCQGNEIRIDSSTHAVNAASTSINTASNIIVAGSLNINTADSNHTNMPTLEATGIFDGAFDERLGPKVNTVAIRPNVNAKSSYFKPYFHKIRHFNQRTAAKTNTFSRKNNTAKGKNVTTAGPKAVVNAVEGKKENVVKSSTCQIWRPKGKLIDHTSKDRKNVTTAGPKEVVNAAEGKKENVVKSSTCQIWRPKGKLIDHTSKESIKRLMVALLFLKEVLKENLVTKPHNKTPYELLIGRSPNLEFMRPFGCPVTILNILDHQGIQTDIHARQTSQEKAVVHEYILLPFISSNPPLSSIIQSSDVNAGDQPGDVNASDIQGDVDEISRNDDVCQGNKIRIDSSTHAVNAASTSINTASNIIAAGSLNINTADSNHTNMPTLEATGIFDGAFDERLGIKARLVAQGHTQKEGIHYDEVFAPVTRIEAIRLFLAYASFKDFIVYQMDVKSAFLYGKIKEEVYVCQPPVFEDPNFPNKVYKLKKALYGLHQALRAWYETLSTYLLNNRFKRGQIDKTLFIKINKGDILLVQMSSMGELTFFLGLQVKQKQDDTFISQDKYVAKILKKFRFSEVKTASTPMETSKPLLKDEDGQEWSENYALLVFVFQTTPQMVINSPCLTDKKELASLGKTTTGKDFRNPLMDEGTACLINEEIFEGLAHMGRIGASFSGVITPLFDTMMVQAHADMGDTLVETHQTPNVDQPSTFKPQKKQKRIRKQRKEAGVSNDELEDEDHVPTPSSDSLPSGEDIFIFNELMVFCTSLQEHVLDLQEAKAVQAKEISGLKKKVTKLNKWRKSRSGGLRRLKKFGSVKRVKSHMERDGLDDKTQGRTNDDEMFRVDDLAGEEVVMENKIGVKDSADPTTYVTEDEVTMAQALAALESKKPKVVVQEQDRQSQIPTVSSLKDKGKAKMIEPEVPIKRKEQIRIDEEYTTKLEAKE
nr:retrovirus-related Pol polyprotein from transposon TNT 1-94 [Tanacetum cinerariifolium]